MRRRLITLLFAPIVLSLALLAGGCGGGDEEGTTETDAAFAAQMLPHHEHAIEMATLALEKSADPGVMDLAQGIIDTQEAEIATLEGLIERLNASAEEPAPEVEALNGGVIAELEAASGPVFDEIFLKEMSAHHSSAVDMAGIEIAGGTDDESVQLAEEIRSTQIEEIGVMQELLGVEATAEHGSDSDGHSAE